MLFMSTASNYTGVIKAYTDSMRRRRDAPGTISARVRVARAWLATVGERWIEATWHDVDAYGDTRNIAASTWRDELSHLHAFYLWAMRNELVTIDPTILVERPRVPGRLPRPVSDGQYARLSVGASPMVLAMLELMAFCGLRCCEVARLRWCDVDLCERVAIVRGKGNRERTIGLPARVVRALAAVDAPTATVITNAAALPYSPARVSQLIGQHARARGVAMTAHQLRHTFATSLLAAANGELLIVQHALGHASVSTTQIYAQVDRRRAVEIAQAMDRF